MKKIKNSKVVGNMYVTPTGEVPYQYEPPKAGKYAGEEGRKARAKNGVGRPPKNK